MATSRSTKGVCARIANRLARTVGSHRYGMWFDRSARLEYDDKDHRLDVSVPNRFIADWIGRHFRDQLCEAAHQELGCEVDLRVSVDPRRFDEARSPRRHSEQQAETETLTRPKVSRPERGTRRMTLRHRLEEFVVGQGNELAYAAAKALIDEQTGQAPAGITPNPLFIHGDCGLGKTHLIQGICQSLQQFKPRAKVLYTTGERFTNEYIHSLRSGKLDEWRSKIRKLDLLAIDDVHFIANKQKTQQEFLHCFDALEMSGARIVLTGDSHPKRIRQFSEALISRCMRGMVVEVQPPDTETRVQIIQTLADKRGISLMDTVMDVVASRCQGSVRELEGTLTKLHALASLTPAEGKGQRTNEGIPAIGHALVNQLFTMERQSSPRRLVHFDTILKVVCDKLELRNDEVLGKGRQRHVVLGRSLLIYLTRQLTNMSFPEIAAKMGRTSHSTIVTAASRIEGQLAEGESHLVQMPGQLESVPLTEVINRLRYAIEHA